MTAAECVIDTCRVAEETLDDFRWGYEIRCVVTYPHDCPTVPRTLGYIDQNTHLGELS